MERDGTDGISNRTYGNGQEQVEMLWESQRTMEKVRENTVYDIYRKLAPPPLLEHHAATTTTMRDRAQDANISPSRALSMVFFFWLY